MARYRKKITRLMEYPEFKDAIQYLSIMHRAFLTLLFFAGCRVSEAVVLTSADIDCTPETIFVQFYRLKGSRQTDPQEIPKIDALTWLCGQKGKLFPFSRFTGNRIVRKAFPTLYPHYFRMNRITMVSRDWNDATVYHIFGISAGSIDHYRGKVDIKRVGKAMRDEAK